MTDCAERLLIGKEAKGNDDVHTPGTAAPDVSAYTVSSVCLRRYPFPRALAVAADLGFDSVDLVGLRGLCEHVPVNGTRADLREAAGVLRASGLRGASINADPGSFDGFDDAADVLRRIDLLLEFAVETETPILVLPAGEKYTERPVDPRVARMADGINAAAERARVSGVRLAVEAPYFGRPLDRVALASDLLAQVDPGVQLAFDVSHVRAAGESVLAAWGLFASRVAIVHLRDAVDGDIRRVMGAGDIDFAALLAAAEQSGFAGDVVLELETRDSPFASKEDEVVAAVRHLTAVREERKLAAR